MNKVDILPAELEVTRDDNDVLVSAVLKLGGQFAFPFKWVAWDVQLDKFAHLEPKQGEWIKEIIVEEPRKNKRAYARCSACGCLYNHYGVAVKHFDFCPKCGARMKGSDHHDRT